MAKLGYFKSVGPGCALCARCSGRAPALGFSSLSQGCVVSHRKNYLSVSGPLMEVASALFHVVIVQRRLKIKKPIQPLSLQSLVRDGCRASADYSWIRACSLICCCCFDFKLEQAHRFDPCFFAGVHPWCPSGICVLVSHSWAALFKQRHILSACDSHPVWQWMASIYPRALFHLLGKGPLQYNCCFGFQESFSLLLSVL